MTWVFIINRSQAWVILSTVWSSPEDDRTLTRTVRNPMMSLPHMNCLSKPQQSQPRVPILSICTPTTSASLGGEASHSTPPDSGILYLHMAVPSVSSLPQSIRQSLWRMLVTWINLWQVVFRGKIMQKNAQRTSRTGLIAPFGSPLNQSSVRHWISCVYGRVFSSFTL